MVALTVVELASVQRDLAIRPLDGAIRRPVSVSRWGLRHCTPEDVEIVTDWVLRRVRLTRVPCLPRALVRFRLLRRAGWAPVFKMGVRAGPDGDVAGHAWVELDGAPFAERESTDYTVTLSHGGSA